MRPSEHGIGVGVGEGVPDCSVTGVGLPNLLSFGVCELARGDVLAGRFQIEAVIGNGGSGRVLRAFDRESRMLVALKILRQELAGEAVWAERFSRELRVGRAISHPNVCRVFDIGDADGHKFLSLELATRGSLRSDVPKNDGRPGLPLPSRAWQERAADARAIVEGVSALHTAGIVHRDLKPENILRMEDGRLVVTDFGLATDPGSGPGTTIMVGTPSYMAPEVVMGDPATARSDVWGLGVVLHEVFFGVRPRWKVVGRGYRRYLRPEDVKTAVECAVADLCGRCADDAPDLRPASAIEVLRELERALLGKKVVARHVRRRMVWSATAVATMAALIVVKARFTNQAEASSAQVAAAVAGQVLQPTGTAADWSKGSTKLASLGGNLHCYAAVEGGAKVRVIWGTPRKAEDIDVTTGGRAPADLLPETYLDGCPALSPDGKSLLFEKGSETGSHVFLSRSPNGAAAKQLVRGSEPQWLPNGQEIVFAVDARHAAMFSIPTGDLSLLSEPKGGIGKDMFAGLAVDSTGTRLAVRYATLALDSLIVVYALPGLEPLGQVHVPFSNGPLRFSDDTVQFSYESSTGGTQLASADWRSISVRNIAAFPGAKLDGVVAVNPDQTVFAMARRRYDLWSKGVNGFSRITDDGDSLHGAYSSRGDLIFQRRLVGGKRAIFVRKPNGNEKQVTSGPLDLTPTFLPGGDAWLYVAFDRAEIVKCETEGLNCRPLHRDASVPGFPSVNPSGTTVAYVTLMTAQRVRTFSLARPDEYRDLGPVGGTCTPYWTTNKLFWVAETTSESAANWVEIDSEAGRKTGRIQSVAVQSQEECALPEKVLALSEKKGESRVLTLAEDSAALLNFSSPRALGQNIAGR
ncbi:MAG TPA: protein kinase [Polyangia bacterium]